VWLPCLQVNPLAEDEGGKLIAADVSKHKAANNDQSACVLQVCAVNLWLPCLQVHPLAEDDRGKLLAADVSKHKAPRNDHSACMLQVCAVNFWLQCFQVNPLAEDDGGKLIAADAKLGFDDSAAYRQKDIFALKDESQLDSR
jgi:hypothetical protein